MNRHQRKVEENKRRTMSWLLYFDNVMAPHVQEQFLMNKALINNYIIAGKKIRIHILGEHLLEKYTFSLAHTKVSTPIIPDLNIYVWEKKALPGPKISAAQYFANTPDNFKKRTGFYEINKKSTTIVDTKNKRAFLAIEDINKITDWVISSPLRTIFYTYFSDFSIQLVHGAVVGNEQGGVLITAKGGSGKSTTAMSCLEAGMQITADDYTAINSKSLKAYSIYSALKLVEKDLDQHPLLKNYVYKITDAVKKKVIVFLPNVYPDKIKKEMELKAVFIPYITRQGKTEIVPYSKEETLNAMLPSTIGQNKYLVEKSITTITNIVEKLPCYQIRLGTDKKEIPSVIQHFLNISTNKLP